MFDFLDKTGLKAVLEQIKAKFPSSLPANGGNADYAANAGNAGTVGGKSADDFAQIIDFGFNQTDTKIATGKSGKATIYRCTNWTDYPSEFIDSQATLIAINYNGSGTAGTDWIWCTQIIVNPRQGNRIYVRYIDSASVLDWKEISTQPIKSVQVGGATDSYGKFLLWTNENNKIPVCVETSGYRAYTFVVNSLNEGGSILKIYYISLEDANTNSPAQNKSVTATVYYVEI